MSSITEEDLRTIVSRAVGANASVLSHRIEPLGKRVEGIMSNRYALHIDVTDEGNSMQVLDLFVKIPSGPTSLADEKLNLEELHYFRELQPLMEREWAGERWSPRCYLATPEAIVLEDLRSRGFATSHSSIFNEKTLEVALGCLARFHAATVLLEVTLGERLDQRFPKAFPEKVYGTEGKIGRSCDLVFKTFSLLAEELGLDAANLAPRILKKIRQLIKPTAGGRNVVCHGDLWRSNIMFEEGVQPSRCLLVDYQMLRYASPATDVAMLLYVHSTREFRESRGERLLEHYHSTLLETCAAQVEAIPRYSDFRAEYEECKLLGMACAAAAWPAIVFSEVLDDPTALERWYFHERVGLYSQAMDRDPLYKDSVKARLTELFEEARRVL